jgi:hypothetical protein
MIHRQQNSYPPSLSSYLTGDLGTHQVVRDAWYVVRSKDGTCTTHHVVTDA